MQLERSRYQSGSEPEVLTVRFSDSVTEDAHLMKSPKSCWRALAEETARNLGIEMHMREMDDGTLAAAFNTADDCNSLVAAMQPDWKPRLLEGLTYHVQLLQTALYRDADEFEKMLDELASEYNLQRSDFDDILLSDDEAYHRHLDLYM